MVQTELCSLGQCLYNAYSIPIAFQDCNHLLGRATALLGISQEFYSGK